MEDVIRGTDIKYDCSIETTGGTAMSSYNFKAIAYCIGTAQRVVISKEDCTQSSSNMYVLPIDTSSLGLGQLIVDIYAYIPDRDFPDGLRTEIHRTETDINIIQ